MSVYQNKSGLFVGGTSPSEPSTPGTADELSTTVDPVNVSSASPPVSGQVLTATDGTHAVWRVPGLKYDAAIRFNADSLGTATIEPNTWGFVQTAPVGSTGVTIFIVSSLAAPPVDSRFGLYISPTIGVPVTVELVGASQIMGLDGSLQTSIQLPPGAMFEWVFYHEGGVAIWGMVSDTAHQGMSFIEVSGPTITLKVNEWTFLNEEPTTFILPEATAPDVRMGFYAGEFPVEVGCDSALSTVFWGDGSASGTGSTITVQPFTWAEWRAVKPSIDPTQTFWIPVATAVQPPPTVTGWLSYTGGTDPANGQWVIASNSTTSSLPAITAPGEHVAIYVTKGTTGATVTGASDSFQIDRNIFNSAEVAPLRDGSWYEWVSVDFGESFRWVPVGGSATSARPPLEYPEPPYGDPVDPNQWVLTSTDSAVNFPNNPQHGDVFGIYADIAGTAAPANGTSLEAPDLSSIVAFPSNIALTAGTYYEWIFTAGDDTWHPRQNLLMIPARTATAYKEPVRVAANSTLALTGLVSIDSVVVAAGNRVLATQQADATTNGIYVVSSGAWTRALDADSSAELPTGTRVPVSEGTTFQDTVFVLTTNAPITLGSTALSFSVQGGMRGTGNAPPAISPGNSSLVGSLNRWAAADHTHQLLISYKEPVRVVSTTNIATLSTLLTVDGVTLVNGDRVLLVGQSTASTNGIWIASTASWSRAGDNDGAGDLIGGATVAVLEGSTNTKTVWMLTTTGTITPGSTNIAFTQISGPKATNLPRDLAEPAVGATFGTVPRWAIEDHVHLVQSLHPGDNGYRINNVNTSSIPTSGSSSTVYLVPHTGNRMSMTNNGINFYPVTPSVVTPSIAVTGQTAGIPCDVFAVFGSLTAITLELVPWTNATTRATGLFQLKGVWVKSGENTKRYVGTILPDSATTYNHVPAASGASSPVCGIWNQDNRIRGCFTWSAGFASWSIPSAATWQQLNAQASAKVQYVQGQSIDAVSAVHVGAAAGAAGGSLGIGIDSTSSPTGLRGYASNNNEGELSCRIDQLIAAGAHNLNALAYGGATSVTFVGNSAPMQAGITAELWF